MTMTPLRQRYISDMRLRNLSPRTIDTYTLRVALFARHFGVSPERLGTEHLRAYQEHLIARGVSWSMFNQAVCALRFLYQITLGRTDAVRHLPFAKRPRNWIDRRACTRVAENRVPSNAALRLRAQMTKATETRRDRIEP